MQNPAKFVQKLARIRRRKMRESVVYHAAINHELALNDTGKQLRSSTRFRPRATRILDKRRDGDQKQDAFRFADTHTLKPPKRPARP
jgi:hypothetical protein